MEQLRLEGFMLIGIAIRTSNNNGENLRDIGSLWQRFMHENIISQIPNKLDNDVYSVYTEYEGDYTKPYTTIIGCKTTSLEYVPPGMRGLAIDPAIYQKFIAKGNMSDNIVAKKWHKIWQLGLKRAYTQDFEKYGTKSNDSGNAEVDIYIAIKA